MIDHNKKRFPGFPPEAKAEFWRYPKILDGYWNQLSGSEQKVLDYILRQTWGFKKDKDQISLSILQRGAKNSASGTGLCKQTIITALKGLIRRGFVRKSIGKDANYYELVQNLDYYSPNFRLVASQKNRHTIDDITINNKQYNFLKNKKQKPCYKNMPMRKFSGKWQVYRDSEWTEYAGKKSEIEWK